MQLFSTVGLSRKIAFAFALVLGLHLTVAGVGHVGLENASRDLEQLDQGRKLADRIVAIDDDSVGRLQREILTYTQTGHPALVDRIRQLEDRLVVDLDSTAERASDEDRPFFGRMKESLGRYSEHFETLVIDRERRKNLMEGELGREGDTLEAALREISALADRSGKAEQRLEAEGALLGLISARLDIQRYVSQLDPAAIDAAREQLRGIRDRIERLGPELAANASEPFEAVVVGLPKFEAAVTELVQVTRGYLHLVNVVLAGEAAEFQYESEQLRRRTLDRLDLLTVQVADEQHEFQSASLWISLVTILMGIFAGSAIRRVVVRPLDLIASTLGRLAAGDEKAQIPFTARRDEIGDMARAAEVFRRRNEETARLLDETQRLAQEHAEVIADLERSNAELDNFANVASHDLKAPLRAISSLSEWIEEDMPDDLPDEVRGHLDALRQRTGRMGKLLEDLLAYARAGRAEFELVEVSLHGLGEDVWNLAGFPDGMEFRVTGEDASILAPRVALEQVLGNLFSNAVKHHDEKRGRVELRVELERSFVELHVRDDGPGIAEEHHERIFEVFRTLKRRDEVEASGIGLALVKKHVERVGGTVEVRSSGDGRGSTFVVRWPRVSPGLRPAVASGGQHAA